MKKKQEKKEKKNLSRINRTPLFLMIIIFGNGPKYFIEAEGKFICPNCNFIKRYLVKTSRDYFRLFFIPIIPVGEKSQPYVECQHCKNNWHTNVLDQNNYYLDGKPVTK